MFQFTAFPSIRYGFTYGYLRFAQVGFPIQISPDRWLFAPPRSFRSLPRLSSAPSAKAFSLCSFLLDQFNIIAISLECFVVAIQLLLHLKIENFVFSIDSIFALLVFSFQGASCFIFGRSRDRLNILSWGYFFVNNFFRFLQKFFQNSKSP